MKVSRERALVKPGVGTNDVAPIYGRRFPKLGHGVPHDYILRRSAHISADSQGESGVAGHKVSANRNRCHY